jgi:hypothetical protein
LTLDLTRPRELGALFGDALRLYFRNFGRFLAIGAAVVIPAELIVSGVGLQQLSGGYETSRSAGEQAVAGAVQVLVTTPLIVAMTVYLLIDIAEGRTASLRRAIQSGLDAFRPLFLPVLAAIAAEVLLIFLFLLPIVAVGSVALLAMLVIPLTVVLRLYFVPQAVVVGGARRLDALRASWELTRGFGWRVFATVVLGLLAFNLVAGLVAAPIAAAAKSADSSALQLAYRIVGEVLAGPALALLSALLYFDLKARRSATAPAPTGRSRPGP